MACEIISVEGAVFVLWGKPHETDFERVLNRVELISSASGGPIVFITRVPVKAPPPEGDTRAQMNAMMPRLIKHCSSYHVLLEGSGFVSAVKRAILAGFLQFGFRNGTFFVHENEKGVGSKVERGERSAVEAILNLARAKGLLTGPPPEDVPAAAVAPRTGRASAGQPRAH
jgi:hypothetical protein